MRRILPVKLRKLSSSYPIAYWVVDCIVHGGLLGFILVLFLILIGVFFIFYDNGSNAELIAYMLLPFAMRAGTPWSWMFYGQTYWIPGILGCIILNGLLAGVLYVVLYIFYRFITLTNRAKKEN